MAHFNPGMAGTKSEHASDSAPSGMSRLLTKAERSTGLTSRLLSAQQSKPEAIEPAAPESAPILELSETPELPATVEPSDCAVPDPLIQGLVNLLPKRNSVWSIDDRRNWLSAASSIFSLIYKTDDGTPR
jgi:hypothetical protein